MNTYVVERTFVLLCFKYMVFCLPLFEKDYECVLSSTNFEIFHAMFVELSSSHWFRSLISD